MDNLPNPPYESELKQRAAVQKTISSKQSSGAAISGELFGTSVAPRQRPKGNASSQNLPLVLPSSPSPRNTVSSSSSPSPQVLPSNDPNFDTCDKSSSIPQTTTTTPVSPYALSKPKPKQPNAIPNDLKTPSTATQVTPNENMFVAKFADNFSDDTPQASISAKNEIQSPKSPPIVMNCQHLLNTPPKALAGAGHRRNMSDTSAFNKYV